MSNDSITVRLAPKDIERMDRLIEGGHFTSRSDLVRSSVRRTLESRRQVPAIFEEMRKIADEKGITTEDIVKAVREVRHEIHQEEHGDDDEDDE